MNRTSVDIFSIRDDIEYRTLVIDSVCSGIKNPETLKQIINYFLDTKLHLFEGEIYSGSFYENDDQFLDLVIPSIRRVWAKFFVNPPEILTDTQKELYKLSFDIDDFTDYLIKIIPNVKTSLLQFDELDRTSETLTLIVDNYVAKQIRICLESDDVFRDIRNIKIKKIIPENEFSNQKRHQ